MTTIKEHISDLVRFSHYNDSCLWYQCDSTGFLFPVPISDTSNATFLAVDRGIYFMRYIRKHMKTLENSS